jgi:O-antigen biosynthesis protein
LGIKIFVNRILGHIRVWFATRKQSVQEASNLKTEFARKYLRGRGLAIGPFIPNFAVSLIVSIDIRDTSNYKDLSTDEVYDFVICDKPLDNLTDSIESFQLWLRIIKPGGILYLTASIDGILSKYMSNLQSEIKILDSASDLYGNDKEQIYIIEKANYTSKIVDILGANPNLNTEYTVDVIVPIYNAYEDVEKCLYSLFKQQDIYRIILVNDCSTDKRVKELLNILRKHQCERFKVVENKNNIGYLKTANVGMSTTKNDVILLNSDTMVTSGWARKLRACAYSRHCIATVTPFSNNGVECSIPNPGESNEIPEGFTIDSFAELVENCSINRYPELVTAVGFCMYIRRAVIDEIGYLDEENFGLGYGEENDFSMRATQKGYKNILCDNTFVFHKGGASFSHKRNALIQKSAMVLEKMYPDFWPAMHLFWRSKPLKELHNNIKRAIELRALTQNSA